MVNWPGTGLDSLPKPTGSTKRNDPGFELHTVISDHATLLEAIEAKLGSTVTGTPGRGKALIGKGTDASVWDTNARRNLLVNGSMRVNQRGGAVGTTDNTYIFDRWRILLAAANAAAAAYESGGDVPSDGSKYVLKLTVGSGNNNKFGIFQVLESVDILDLRGKSISLQAKLKATSGIANVRMAVLEFTGTADSVSGDPISAWGADGTNPTLAANWAYLNTPANLSATTSWGTYRVEGLTVGASANNLAVLIWSDDTTTTQTTDVLRVTDVQLEEGAVCTSVERPKFQQELALCQRYYWKSFPYGTTPAQNSGVTNNIVDYIVTVGGTGNFLVLVRFPVVMRTTPGTITYYNPSAANNKWRNLTDGADSGSPTTLRSGDAGLSVICAQVAGDGLGEDIGIHITADAEL